MLSQNIEFFYSLYKECGGKICTDTRKLHLGDLFVSLDGPNFNGNTFAEYALDNGSKYAIVSDASLANNETIFYTQDTLIWLQELAKYHRKVSNFSVLAIGGSNGKTTTKELCKLVLENKYKIHATPGNFNNHIGLPLTLLGTLPDTEICIAELGTNHKGEIAALCEICLPDIGIITNIGKEHLEGFGSIESVAREESELFQFLIRQNGKIILNVDDVWLNSMQKRISHFMSIGIENNAQIHSHIYQEMPFLNFDIHFQEKIIKNQQARLGGKFNMYNILFALAVGAHYHIPLENSLSTVCNYYSSNNRSQWISKNHSQIFLDAYNANPSSVEEVIKSFATLNGSKAIALGDMLELGSVSKHEHSQIAQLALSQGFNHVFFCGNEFKNALTNHTVYSSAIELGEEIVNNKISADYWLVKGSRGMKMEQLIEYIN